LDPQLLKGILSVAFLILSLGIHEAAHARVALRCGDTTARDQGRLTLNPIAHIDPFMTVILPAFLFLSGSSFLFGGARPVPVDYLRLRRPLRDMMLVALAGPLSNLLLAVLFALVWKVLVYVVGMSVTELAPQVMQQAIVFNLVLAIFNMIPVPPLDGSRVMAWLLPGPLREPYVRLEAFGMLIVFGLLLSGVLGTIIWPPLEALYQFVAGPLTGGAW